MARSNFQGKVRSALSKYTIVMIVSVANPQALISTSQRDEASESIESYT
nr:MAG TPA: hypothetical protein [Caudoviricetes sp.]